MSEKKYDLTSSGTDSSQSRSRSPSPPRSSSSSHKSKPTTTRGPLRAIPMDGIPFTPTDQTKQAKAKRIANLREQLLKKSNNTSRTRLDGRGGTKKYNNKRKKMQRAKARTRARTKAKK